MASYFGKNIHLSLFGESHSSQMGITIEGIKPGIAINIEHIKQQLAKRKGKKDISTPRREEDEFEIVSGFFNGYTTGAPLTILVTNTNTVSSDYNQDIIRPSHADYTAYLKYLGFQDYRGGGHFSGRITVLLVIAGAICMQILEKNGIQIFSHIKQIKNIVDDEINYNNILKVNDPYFPTINQDIQEKMILEIKKAKDNEDSVGGVIESVVLGSLKGIGEPFFDSLESTLAHLLFSIPAVKGVEFGAGFGIVEKYGSEVNDKLFYKNGDVCFSSNNSGGINGGITNGMPIVVRVAIKPTPSIKKTQQTINYKTKENVEVSIKGRHDPCIVPRALVVVDSVLAIGILDQIVTRYGYMWMD